MKLLKILLLSVNALAFVSCDNITEEIHLKKDGSGEYGLYYDMVPAAVDMSLQMAVMLGKVDTSDTRVMDSLKTAVLKKVWDDFPDNVDSIIDFAEGASDSLLNYGNNRQYVEKTQGYMRGSREEGFLLTGIVYPFLNTTELNNYLTFLNEAQQDKSARRRGVSSSGINSTKTDANYTYKKNKFKRKVKISNPQDPEEKSFALLKNMMGGATYTTVIHTPGKITNVISKASNEVNDSTATLTYSLLDVLTGDIDLGFEIVWD